MNKEYAVLIERLKTICGKNYKLFSINELHDEIGTNVTEDEVVAILRRLDFGGYIDVKYCDGKEILLKPLNKQYVVDFENVDDSVVKTGKNERMRNAAIFLISFFGAFLGASIVEIVARFVC